MRIILFEKTQADGKPGKPTKTGKGQGNNNGKRGASRTNEGI